MPTDHLENLPPHDRRRFFSAGLGRLIGPLADFVDKRLPIPLPIPLPISRTMLRPPGAMPEAEFLESCLRCGKCADACPANAIVLSTSNQPELKGTPYVDPALQACVICEELACMKVCPSGALTLVDRLEIRMGLARVDHATCVRSTGENCTVCVDKCPLGSLAIRVGADGRIEVIDPQQALTGCTGCGVCEQYCPARPERAIRIVA
ncbi:MAG: 4Fe-4S dicluster domain-containing protein [Planctomycetota bacterium]